MFARKRLVVGGLVVVLLAVGGYAYAGTRGDATSYRTVAASTGTVQRTLSVTGNVAASGRRDLAFGASGTVRKVPVKLGERVRKGQVLCIVEAMKLMNEIEAEAPGKISEILVENGKTVEFGQPLFRIEPV